MDLDKGRNWEPFTSLTVRTKSIFEYTIRNDDVN